MDTLTALTQLLGNGFFPIAVCAALFWYIYKKDQTHIAEIKELKQAVDTNSAAIDTINKTADKITEAVNQNNRLIELLLSKEERHYDRNSEDS